MGTTTLALVSSSISNPSGPRHLVTCIRHDASLHDLILNKMYWKTTPMHPRRGAERRVCDHRHQNDEFDFRELMHGRITMKQPCALPGLTRTSPHALAGDLKCLRPGLFRSMKPMARFLEFPNIRTTTRHVGLTVVAGAFASMED